MLRKTERTVDHLKKMNGENVTISYRKASPLDVPMIFELMQEGAVTGAFSKKYIERTGSLRLLSLILREIIGQHFQFAKHRPHFEWLIIRPSDGREIGFLKRTRNIGVTNDIFLDLLAILPECRNQGFGSAVLEDIASGMTEGAQLNVLCTKYAKAMQHILKRHRFKRNVKFHMPKLEEYSTIHRQD